MDSNFLEIVSKSPFGSLVVNKDGLILFANRAALSLYGRPAEGLIGQAYGHSLDKEIDEINVVREGDLSVPLEAQVSQITWDGSKVFLVSLREVSVRQQRNLDLRRSQDKLVSIFESSPVGMAFVSEDNRFLDVNSTLCNLLEYSEEELLSKNFLDISHPEDRDVSRNAMKSLKAGIAKSVKVEKRYVTKSGNIVWVNIIASVLKDVMGESIYYLTSIENITDRKLAEQTIEEQHRFVENVFSGIQDGISVLDKDLTILKVNPAMEKWYSYASPLAGKKCYEVYHGRSVPCEKCPTLRAISEKTAAAEIVPRRNADGQIIGWLDLHAFPVVNSEIGEVESIIEHVRDVTETKKYQDAVKESEARYRELFETIENGVAIYQPTDDGDFILVDFNPCAERLDHVEKAKILGKKVTEIFPGVKDFGLFDVFKRVNQTGILEVHPVSEYQDERLRAWRENTVYKSPTGEIVAVYVDVTEQKKIEEALYQSEERYRTVANFTHDWEFWISPSFELLYVSPSCERITGYTAEEFLEQQDFLLKIAYPDDVEFVTSHMEQFIKSQEPCDLSIDFRIIHKDRRVVWINHVCAPVFNGEGKYLGRRVSHRDITDRKLLEQALKMSEEQYETLVESFPHSVTVFQDEHLVFLNRKTVEMLGYKDKASAIGLELLDSVPDCDKGRMREFQMKRRSGLEVPRHYFTDLQKKDGSVFPAEVFTKSIVFGGVPSEQVIVIDITKRKQAEQDLIHARDEWEATFDAIPDYLAILDTNFIVTHVNRSMREDLDISYEHLGKVHCYEMVHRTTSPNLDCPHSRVFLSGKQGSAEIYEPHLGKYFNVSVSPIFEDEKVVRCVHIMTDITAQKESETRLRQSRDEFQTIFESSPDMVYVNDLEGYFVRVNQRFTEILGYTNEEVMGRVPYWDGLLLENEESLAEMNHLLEEKKYRLDGYRTIFLTKAGESINVALSTDLIKIEGKSHILTIAKDITEFLRLEDQLHHTSKMEAVGILAGGIAHDFNNALTPVLNATSTLIEVRKVGDKYTQDDIDFLKEADEAARHTADISKQLLQISRRQVFKMVPTDINAMMKRISRMATRYVPATIEIKTVLDPGVPNIILADETQLSQSVLNLILNASDAMPKGGTLTLTTVLEHLDESYVERYAEAREGDFIKICVSDTGVGIPKKVLSKIFDPFFTTKSVGKGTGLGLSRVFSTVKGHNGWINVYSELKKGTCIKLYIPVVESQGVEIVKEPAFSEVPHGTETILVVDDFESVLKTAKNVLSHLGYSVVTCTNGEEALSILGNGGVDLVITDLIMPKMGGKRLIKHMRAGGFQMPVILMSGYPETMVYEEKPKEAFDGFIEKPFRSAELGQTIRQVLDNPKEK